MSTTSPSTHTGNVEKVFKMTMSRGETESTEVDLERLEDYVVFDDRDNAVRFGDIYRHKRTIILFLRHPQCYTAKEYLDDLSKVPLDLLESVDTQIAVFFPVRSELLYTIKSEFMFKHKLYSDPECSLYKAIGFSDTVESQGASAGDSKHVKSGLMSGILQSTYRAMWYQDFSANIQQNGGCLIAGPGRLLHHCHKDKNMFGHIAINDALELVGASVLSFQKDPRVITI